MSKIIATCLGCEKSVTERTHAIEITHHHEDGTASTYAVCLACMVRAQRDEVFSNQLNWRSAQLPRTVAA